MKRTEFSLFVLVSLLALCLCLALTPGYAADILNTNFENFTTTNWQGWSADNGVWEVGTPTSGPNAAHEGVKCAATVLGGNYPTERDSRLISPSLNLPFTSGQSIILKFWQWFNYDTSGEIGRGYVEVSVWDGAAWGDWTTIYDQYNGVSSGWQYVGTNFSTIDLSPYAGKRIRIAFYHAGRSYAAPGWYLDEVRVAVEAKPVDLPLNQTVTFEGFTATNWQGWSANNGVWNIGVPTSGPDTAHEGTQCAATILGGNYPTERDSRLESPPVTLPTLTANQQITLKFWQWFNYETSGDIGRGYVEVSVWDGAAWGDWTTIYDQYNGGSSGWQYVGTNFSTIDLSPYAGKRIRVAFYHAGRSYSAPGWYLDEVRVAVEAKPTDLPLNQTVTFESFTATNWQGWSASNGVWNIGVPTSGPGAAHEGTQCAATILGGNYPTERDSRLESPPVTLPALTADQQITLKFWQWFSYDTSGDIGRGYIDVSVWDGASWGAWTTVFDHYDAGSSGWQYAGTNFSAIDLSPYAGKRIRIGFYHAGRSYAAAGWYLDEVRVAVEAKPADLPLNQTVTFESFTTTNWQGWSASNGVWNIGVPTSGPSAAHEGTQCAATILGGNYPTERDSRLESPPVTLPTLTADQQITLKFWQWFNYETSGDIGRGYVEVSVWDGAAWGDWTNVYDQYNGGSSGWQYAGTNFTAVDLSPYAGKRIRIAFYHAGRSYAAPGWYLDEVRVAVEAKPADLPLNQTVTFEGFSAMNWQGWSANNGVWNVGVPTSGPGAAHEGTQCAATILGGNYPTERDSRLESPPVTLPTLTADQRIMLNFWQWFKYETSGDIGRGSVEVATIIPLNDDFNWVDDILPAGGGSYSNGGDGWNWVSMNPAPYSGAMAHQSNLVSGYHGHYFQNATKTMDVGIGDILFTYIYLDPVNPPLEVMLQWTNGNWEHRAYWGSNKINLGTDSTNSRKYMGALPPTGQWVRLEVPARLIGLEKSVVNGMAFTLYDGRATWDRAGRLAGSERCDDWTIISDQYTGSSGGWKYVGTNYPSIDLSAYAGKRVKLGFQHHGGSYAASGWFIDEVTIYVPPSDITFTPAFGAVGSTVTITGKYFSNVTDVTFNGTPAAFTVLSDSSLTAVVPDGATDGRITLTAPVGSASSAKDFIVNFPPVANAQSVWTNKGVTKAITLRATEADGDALTYSVVTNPTHGTLTGTAPNLSYKPTTGYAGADSFTFKANDGLVDSNVATVSITVNTIPVANAQSLWTNVGVAKAITLTGSDADGDTLTYRIVAKPAHGLLTGTLPNQTYTPVAGYAGADSFTFCVRDGKTDSATVTVSITVNTIPVATAQSVWTVFGVAKALTLTGLDADGNTLTYKIGALPTHGLLTGTAPAMTYTPTPGYAGADSFTFTVNDGKATSSPATVSITVDTPPAATAQSVWTNVGVAKAITLTGSDADNNPLTYIVASNPTHGFLTGTAPNLTYTPATGYAGPDSFTFTASDGMVESDPATVSITVNTPPLAKAQTLWTNKGVAKAITLTGSDADGDKLTYAVGINPTHGLLTGTIPNLTYTPTAGYAGPDSFTFTVNDGKTDSAPATISLTVNTPPVANAQSVWTKKDVAKTIKLTGADADGNTLTYKVVTPPVHGTLTGTAPGVIFTPESGYLGFDSFTFAVNDGKTTSATAKVQLTVGNVQPDVAIRLTTNPTFIGDDIYNVTGVDQTVAGTAGNGAVAQYTIKIQNDGELADTFTLTGSAGGNGWTAKYTDQSTDITAKITSATGWTLPVSLLPGQSREIRVEVVPSSVVAVNALAELQLTATSKIIPANKDMVKSRTTCLAGYQPDALFRLSSETTYLGDGIYSPDGTGETKTATTAVNTTVVYYVRLQNDGNVAQVLRLTGTAAPAGWTVKYVLTGNLDITAQLTGAGYTLPEIAARTMSPLLLQVQVTPTNTLSSATCETRVTVTSAVDAGKSDTVKLTTSTSITRQPDASAQVNGGVYVGGNIYNSNGTDQTVSQSVSTDITAIYRVKLENDGNVIDTYALTGTGGANGWTVKYTDLSTDITAQVTTTAGWTLPVSLLPGQSREIKIEVTPSSVVVVNALKELTLTAISKNTAASKDVVKLRTTCAAGYRPDALLRLSTETVYVGDNIYSTDGTGETKEATVAVNTAVIYYVRLQNDGNVAQTLRLTGTAAPAGWTVKYILTGNLDITAQMTGVGYTLPSVAARTFSALLLQVQVTPTNTLTNTTCETRVTVTSTVDAGKSDTVKMTTTATTARQSLVGRWEWMGTKGNGGSGVMGLLITQDSNNSISGTWGGTPFTVQLTGLQGTGSTTGPGYLPFSSFTVDLLPTQISFTISTPYSGVVACLFEKKSDIPASPYTGKPLVQATSIVWDTTLREYVLVVKWDRPTMGWDFSILQGGIEYNDSYVDKANITYDPLTFTKTFPLISSAPLTAGSCTLKLDTGTVDWYDPYGVAAWASTADAYSTTLMVPPAPYIFSDYFMPLTIGNKWCMKSPSGNLSTKEVLSQVTINGQQAMKVTGGWVNDGYSYSWNDALGSHFIGFESTTGTTEFMSPPCLLPASGLLGQQYTYTGNWMVNNVNKGVVTIKTTATTAGSITVPAGTFNNCIVSEQIIQLPGEAAQTQYSWSAPGIGEIKVSYPDGSTYVLNGAVINGHTYGTAP